MNDLISVIRTDQKREINEREHKGFLIPNSYMYTYISKIVFYIDDNDSIEMGIQANQRELNFILIDDGANEFFSVEDIYMLLKEIYNNGNEQIAITFLNSILNIDYENQPFEKDSNCKIKYKGVDYPIREINIPQYDGSIFLEDGSKMIKYKELFALIFLIQSKSNAFFMRGNGRNKAENMSFLNGLTRLWLSLISTSTDCELLNKRGWFWSDNARRFTFRMPNKDSEYYKKKYYLTKEEFEAIMDLES